MNLYKNQALPIFVNLPFFMLETVFLTRSSENFLSLSGSKPEQYILIAVTRAKAWIKSPSEILLRLTLLSRISKISVEIRVKYSGF